MQQRILIVDDDPTTCTMTRVGLDKAGFATMMAHNGKDAIQKIKLRAPDLILTDVNMPDTDGVDLIVQMRSTPETQKIPIVIMTSSGHLEQHFKKINIHYFLPKPFKTDDLVQTVRNALTGTSNASS